ncbi:MAG: glycoside hydrolase family 27 protein [Steroidobacteraceae bacterium]
MGISRREVLAGIALSPVVLRAAQNSEDFRRLAPAPPMGWNSWDSFATTIREEEARAVAQIMAAQLLPHGYNIFTIDAQWNEPGANSFDYRKDAALSMDEWGRLIPAANRFPSAAHGAGFKPLADHIHSLGLKFGIHMMRGVPRQAARQNTPILGARSRANDIADRVNVCAWNADMYGIDMSKPGAQEYYDSIFRLYASWGVDFVKADDMSRPYFRNAPEIHAVHRAIGRCGRPMLLSLSPGETPLAAAADVALNANLWRISDDFWDTWPLLLEQFDRLKNWSSYARPGNWPDADMLPLGTLELGRRKTRFTAEEQVTLLTLWSIARSPLMMGGDLRKLDDFTLSLLTNDEVLAVNQASIDGRELFRKDGLAAWRAKSAVGQDIYVAVFNLRETPAPVTIKLEELGVKGVARVRDLWQRSDLKPVQDEFVPLIPRHGAGLFRLSAA